MPPQRPDERVQEEVQADEDVEPVEAREAVERRAEGEVLRREPEARVLARLDQEKRQAEHEREREAADQPLPVVALDRLESPVHREARRDEDDRVEERE